MYAVVAKRTPDGGFEFVPPVEIDVPGETQDRASPEFVYQNVPQSFGTIDTGVFTVLLCTRSMVTNWVILHASLHGAFAVSAKRYTYTTVLLSNAAHFYGFGSVSCPNALRRLPTVWNWQAQKFGQVDHLQRFLPHRAKDSITASAAAVNKLNTKEGGMLIA